jgi:hypothetical protein
MALRLTGEKTYFASEASVFRLPKADNLIIYPAFLVIMAAKEFFVDHYNHGRDRKNLDNLTPLGRRLRPRQDHLSRTEKVKRQSIQHRRLQHRVQAV